ncbi:LysR family transcriptional regulator [Haematobacter genomosp. 1]|uniref:LysR family transcriptional regulator n=1 Tax=Haematobacter genomosp. 1 TaxID=366618 RepID=A0A212AE35_9RHOB|nr:LysR family transcriptional regulator [Haematobacter genomosp. 1]OWJ79467.1 LysR family transcriptional regulator [Haematobacter genomosp. 1]
MSALLALKLSQFRLIAAIAEHGRLQSAAEALALTQPAASRMLSEIERIVGAPLFERHPRGMAPTLLGRILIRRAQGMMTAMTDLSREVQEMTEGRGGLVRAGAVTGPAVGYVVPAVRKLKALAPDVELRLDVGPSPQLVRGLEAGEYDFVVARLPGDADAAAFEITAGQVEMVHFVVRDGHPLGGAADVPVTALSDHPWIIQERGTPIRLAVERALLRNNATVPADVIATSSLVLMIALLRDSDAIGPMASEVAALLTHGGRASGLTTLKLAMPVIVPPYDVLTIRGRALSPAARRLRSLVTDEIRLHQFSA